MLYQRKLFPKQTPSTEQCPPCIRSGPWGPCGHLGQGTGARASLRQQWPYSCAVGKADGLPVEHLKGLWPLCASEAASLPFSLRRAGRALLPTAFCPGVPARDSKVWKRYIENIYRRNTWLLTVGNCVSASEKAFCLPRCSSFFLLNYT